MHELSLCRSIDTIVRRAAGERKVAAVELDIGELRQVVPSTLRYCWQIVSRGTQLAGSELVVRRIPGVIECADCGARTTLDTLPILRCASCGGTAVEIVAGEEFMVTSLQLED